MKFSAHRDLWLRKAALPSVFFGKIVRFEALKKILLTAEKAFWSIGGLAQMVERPLCMREAPGSMPGFSTYFVL